MPAIFMDSKAEFDLLEREKIYKTMDKKSMKGGLRKGVAEIFREMKSKVRV